MLHDGRVLTSRREAVIPARGAACLLVVLLGLCTAARAAPAPTATQHASNPARPTALDSDRDDLDDATEAALLARFRPFYLFTKHEGESEHHRPADPLWYIKLSELLEDGDEGSKPVVKHAVLRQDPGAVLSKGDFSRMPAPRKLYINPMEDVPGVAGKNPGRKGESWETVLAQKNVGLFGHVTPVQAVFPVDTGPHDYIKIEYWQFFGYNSAEGGERVGDHEGDWATVQLYYDPSRKQIRAVEHWAHGRCHRLTMRSGIRQSVAQAPWGTYQQLDGPNARHSDYRLDQETHKGSARERCMHDTTLRLYQDPVTKEFSHPVVYIEHGSHEYWPTENGKFCVEKAGHDWCAPHHKGNDHAYLTENVPNLGEVEAPSGRASEIILRYPGRWGAFGRENSPPPGPALHCQWTWPRTSKLADPGNAVVMKIPMSHDKEARISTAKLIADSCTF